MERKLIKKIVIAIMLLSIVFMYSLTKVSLADTTTPIDLNSLDDLSTGTGNNTPANNAIGNNAVGNTTNNTLKVNNAVANTSKLPQTGSNNEIIFVVGLTVLVGTTIFIYRKAKIF